MRAAVREDFKAPVLSYEAIRQQANAFLDRYHPSRKLPIPIEDIVDVQLEIFTVPFPGLLEVFEIDAFTTSDCREIHVDAFVYNKRPRRYRFSLAHELGHIVLHQELYQAAQFHWVREWKQFVTSFPGKEYHWFEYQAYSFSGLVLAPREELEHHAEEAVCLAASHDLDVTEETVWEYIADSVADVFEVSKEVIEKRFLKDGIRHRDWLRNRGLIL